MSKKKTRFPASDAAPTPAAAAAAAAKEPRANRIADFLERRSMLIAIAVIALGALRIIATYADISIIYDEPGHFACGLQYLGKHVYLYESQHPPLARAMSALGPFLTGARPMGVANQDLEGIAVLFHSGRPGTLLTLMRLGILPFFVLASLIVYLWAKRYFGNGVAALAAALFTIVPTVLAHGGVATTDMPLTACFAAAYFAMLLWVEEPTWKRSLLFGVATGFAVCTKFTVLGFLPAAATFSLIAYALVKRPAADEWLAQIKRHALPFAVSVGTGAIVIWTIYLFSFGPVPGWGISLPAPELFDGIRVALAHNSNGHAAYLLGEISNRGWWYFFLVALAVKTPLGWLLLTGIGIAVAIARRTQLKYLLPIAFALGVLIPAMTSHVNIGLRHILPIFVALSILAALGLMRLIEKAATAKWAGALAFALVAWIVISGAAKHPDYLAYFNGFAGDHPERILVDSDLDWGQNTIRLARRLKELGATHVAFNEFAFTPQQLSIWPGLPPVSPINALAPAEGWNVVSPTRWVLRRYNIKDGRQPWFPYFRPTEKVGELWLYYFPPGSVQQPQR